MVEILNYRNALPLDSVLLEYKLESVLGAGGFGITYLAYDSHLQIKVAIKEYLPTELAVRALDGAIVPINTGTEYNYKWGLDGFLQEARLLAKFSHPNIVQVLRYFEANGTAYMVMNYESGLSFSQLLRRIPQPDEAMLQRILFPLMEGLEAVHAAGFLHRDIKPSNIFIRDSGVPILLDFGAARLAIGGVTRTMTSILTPGYAPLEQYAKEGNQGPWTDVYSLAAVMYRAVTADNPPDAVSRLKSDTVLETLSTLQGRYSTGFLHGINRGMERDEKKRPQTVAAWRAVFSGESLLAAAQSKSPAAAAGEATVSNVEDAPTERIAAPVIVDARAPFKLPSMAQLSWAAAGALVLFLVIGGEQIFQKPAPKDAAKPPSPTATFATLDRDGDGYLTPLEVKGNAVLEANFAKMDANGDGRISPAEFQSRR